MSQTNYTVEFAKSSRSKCKRCKQGISKGEMRLVVMIPAAPASAGFDMSSNYHVGCFKMPRKYVSGSNAMTPEAFVAELVTDGTDDQSILPGKLDEIIGLVAAAATKKTSMAKSEEESDEKNDSFLAEVKRAALIEVKAEEGAPPAKKKAKKGRTEEFNQFVILYKDNHKKKADDLKDYLRWNRQVLQGRKDFVLFKVLDGMVHGRLGNCPLDGGRLKFDEPDCDHVVCMGRFDEDNQMRIPCEFQGDRNDAKLRCQPFYQEEPTEKEKEAMDKLQEAAQGGGESGESAAGQELMKAIETCDWNLDTPAGLKKAAGELVKLVQGKVDLPEGRDPKRLLGQVLIANKDKGPKGVVQEVIAKFGFKEDKEAKEDAKQVALEAVCANPKNAPLLMAFSELSNLYFKEGNRNAGASYQKVVGALKNLGDEVTEDNAMSFSKGKTKIPGVGKTSAERMREFMKTGIMEKLEEKRAAQA